MSNIDISSRVSPSPQVPTWHGWVFALAIFAGQVVGALAECQYFQIVMRVGLQTRSVLLTSIFRKSLVLSQKGWEGLSTGRINNLISSDTENLQAICQNFHTCWSAPLRIIIAIAMLYQVSQRIPQPCVTLPLPRIMCTHLEYQLVVICDYQVPSV